MTLTSLLPSSRLGFSPEQSVLVSGYYLRLSGIQSLLEGLYTLKKLQIYQPFFLNSNQIEKQSFDCYFSLEPSFMLSTSHQACSFSFYLATYLHCQTKLLFAVNFSSKSKALFIEVSWLPWYGYRPLGIYIVKFIFIGLQLCGKNPRCTKIWLRSVKYTAFF